MDRWKGRRKGGTGRNDGKRWKKNQFQRIKEREHLVDLALVVNQVGRDIPFSTALLYATVKLS